MERKLAIICIVLGALCFVMLGVLDCALKEKFSRAEYGDCVMKGEERERFHKLLRKHGLQYDMVLIRDWPENPWYTDKKGRRIKFR